MFNNVSIDRLKTAHLPLHSDENIADSSTTDDSFELPLSSADTSTSFAPASSSDEEPLRMTRRGRIVRPPAILDL